MKENSTAQSVFSNLRLLTAGLVCAAACLTATSTLLGFFRSEVPARISQRTLTFAQRVAYQRAIEEVYWHHRIWPRNGGERPDPKPSLDVVMSQAKLEEKVADYLRKSQALDDYWQRPITAEQLQAEMDRIAKNTRQPEVLHQVFKALGNDPFVIAECLARPALAERLLTSWYVRDERIHGQTLESWLARAEDRAPNSLSAPNARYVLPVISDGSGCVVDTWTPTAAPPDGRRSPTAVWTGSEMIVWGGAYGTLGADTGGRYNPATDTWTLTTTANAPSGRQGHTAVWTGDEMIIWGGTDNNNTLLNTGGRYNPIANSWSATSITNAPDGRYGHTAIWSGSEMIVWSGGDFPGNIFLNTGGRYNPSTDSWTATSTTNAPTARRWSAALWTGSEMVVWGGADNSTAFDTGGRYNPSTNSWAATSTTNVPTGRFNHAAVWTGNELIVWGGNNIDYTQLFFTGGRYNPSTDSWTPTSTVDAPSARLYHTGIWTGDVMIVWGGIDGPTVNTGGRYNPATNTWTATSTANAPSGRILHSAVWTGSEMIVWGGGGVGGFGDYFNTGGRYNPGSDSWTPTGTSNAPSPRTGHTAVWTGSEMIVWGGDAYGSYLDRGERYWTPNSPPTPTPTPLPTGTPIPSHGTGGRYVPSTDNWTATRTGSAPSARNEHTAIWTGSEMVVWGGFDSVTHLSTGGRYNPATNSWTATSTSNAPDARSLHTAVWAGSEMIVWGGHDFFTLFNTGGRYNPGTDSWTTTSTNNVPTARYEHTAVWTGSEMIVWGGGGGVFNTGGRYNPSTDGWATTNTINAPTARVGHTAVWTGDEMIVWGGFHDLTYEDTGGRYNPISDSWLATSIMSAPSARTEHTAVWTDSEMIIWGGVNYPLGDLNDGGRYNPSTDAWMFTATTNAPDRRSSHSAIWTGSEMIVWGGQVNDAFASSGGRYCVQPGPTPTPTPTATATETCVVTSVENCDSVVFTPPTDFTVGVSCPIDPFSGCFPGGFTVNNVPADSCIVSDLVRITFRFNTSPAVRRLNTIHIAGAVSCCLRPLAEFTCTFQYDGPRLTPTPRPRPTVRPRP
jgi:N-acetylneuraminic acid mutarotase